MRLNFWVLQLKTDQIGFNSPPPDLSFQFTGLEDGGPKTVKRARKNLARVASPN